MNWYRPLECDNTVANPLVCNWDNLEEQGHSEWDFKDGKRITNWSREIAFKATTTEHDGDPDDALQNHLILPIYSRRLTEALEKKGIAGLQFLPISVARPNDKVIEGFQLVNILSTAEALDLERSEFSRYEDDFPNVKRRGRISRVRKYVLKADRIKDMDVFRLREYPQAFFVSETFRDIFTKGDFTGYSFYGVELA